MKVRLGPLLAQISLQRGRGFRYRDFDGEGSAQFGWVLPSLELQFHFEVPDRWVP